ncbi:MAG TPA: GAF domain-containing protein [Thermoflexia bacterium]|jgi:two-component system phosphate regulon sensor histidine kinase PhoR|nr:GAF domain-containing protein [Thermoflexia bacterium]
MLQWRGDDLPAPVAEDLASLLYKILRRCSTSLDLEMTLNEALAQTIEALGAERGSLFLLDRAGRVIRQIGAQRGLDEEEFAWRVEQVMERGLAGWAVRHRQVALAADTKKDGRWHRFPGDRKEAGSAIAVPLVHRGEVVGVMTLQHTQRGFFGLDDTLLAEVVAAQVAVAVANARLHDAMRREQRILRGLIAALPDPVLLLDTSGRVTLANEQARALLGSDVLDRPLREVVGVAEVTTAFQIALERGEVQQIEVDLEGKAVFDAALVPVPGLGIVLRLHDVTRLRRLDELKSQVVAATSHDLRSPLAYVQGFAEVLLQEGDLSETAERCVMGILTGVRRMYALIDHLLDLARIEGEEDRIAEASCDLRPVIDSVVDDLSKRIEAKGQALEIDVPTALPALRMECVDLQRVLVNLIENAVKYTQAGGRIGVVACEEGDGVRISVVDNGPGIPAEAQTRLFERFYRVDGAGGRRGGVGLGLSIVRALVERHGGHVGVESEVGKGSTFWFWLPRAASDAPVP